MAHDAPSNHDNVTLHPALFRVVIAVPLFWVVAAGLFLSIGNYSNVVLGVLGVFAVITLGIPLLLRRVARHHGVGRRNPDNGSSESLRSWLHDGFDVWGDRMTGLDAAVAILSIYGAVCVLGVAFVIIFRVVSAGVH